MDRHACSLRAGGLIGLVLMSCVMTGGAQAKFTSSLQVGNWSGGPWADDTTGQFANCGLSLKFSGGTELTAIVNSAYAAVFVIADPKIQATPQQRFDAKGKFDQGVELAMSGLAFSPTMVQLALPAFPNAYDMVRDAKRFTFAVPGLTSTIDITGIHEVLPKLYECALAGHGGMALAPTPPGSDTPADRLEAVALGTVVAERSGVGSYIVFADKDRPPTYEKATGLWGFLGVPGPDGPANVLAHDYWYPPREGQTTQSVVDTRKASYRGACGKAPVEEVDLPPPPGKPEVKGVGMACNGGYEELYMIPRKNGGHYELTLTTAPGHRKTVEAMGAKYRAAMGAVIP